MEPEKQPRWTSGKKTEIVLSLLKGEKSLTEICRKNDLKQSEVEKWKETFLKSGQQGLKTTSKDLQNEHEKELKELRAKVGELYLELDARKKLQALLDQEEN